MIESIVRKYVNLIRACWISAERLHGLVMRSIVRSIEKSVQDKQVKPEVDMFVDRLRGRFGK